MVAINSARIIQSFYRHWRWGQAVKEVVEIAGTSKKMIRQSGYNPPYEFHLQYVGGTPSWCCPAKHRDYFDKTKEEIVEYLIRQRVNPLTLESVKKIQRNWRKHNKRYGNIYAPEDEVRIQHWWRANKIKRGSYFTMTPRAIGRGNGLKHKSPQLGRVYQYQEHMVFHVQDPKAKCTFLVEQNWNLPLNQSDYILRIIV
jgi:hypothetical protein